MGALTRCVLLAIWLVSASVAANARAAQPAAGRVVSIDLAVCDAALDTDALTRQLGLELRALALVPAIRSEHSELTLEVLFSDCASGARVAELRARSSQGGEPRVRSVDMSDTARDDRPRALALCASELLGHVLAVTSAVAESPKPAESLPLDAGAGVAPQVSASPKASVATEQPATVQGMPRVASRWSAGAEGTWRRLFDHGQWLSGVHVYVSGAPTDHFQIGLGVQALTGRSDAPLEHYRVASLLSELALDAVWGNRIVARAGPRFLLGEAFARGVESRPAVGSSPARDLSVGAGFAIGAQARLYDGWSLSAQLGAGTFARGLAIRVDGRSVATTRGPWLDASLGFTLAL